MDKLNNLLNNNNKQIICILGKSGSGKDYTANKISKEYNIPILVSYTTREMRVGETNGKEHWFITNEQADNMLSNNSDILAYTEINGIRYFGLVSDIKDKVIYVIDPKGLYELKDMVKDKGIDIIVIYVNVSDSVRESRVKNRDKGDYDKYYKSRCESEKEMFREFESRGEWDLEVGG